MEDCTQVIDISSIGFDISDLGRVKVATLFVNETSYDIFKGENVIGRDECSDILFRNNNISNKHAVVEVEDWESHMIYDCGSTNRTRLGKIFLKPNVRYNLQGGEDIFFADVKAKYIKLDRPETVDDNEESVSNAGSESLLNSVPVDLEQDVDGLENDQLLPSQAQKNQPEDYSRGSNRFSDVNDSSLMEVNKQKPSASKLQIVEASDDSTDEEVDFIPPSQTVKEFVSRNKCILKKNCTKNSSADIFSTENSVLNTQEEEKIFMDVVSHNLISNSLNTQRTFSSEVQGPSVPKTQVVCDPRIFEAETQDFISDKNNQFHFKGKASSDIFDVETEIEDTSSDDVIMSNLELSNALSVSVVSTQKSNLIKVNTVEKIEVNSPEKSSKNDVSLLEQENKQALQILPKDEDCDFISTRKLDLSPLQSKNNVILKVKEETIDSFSTENINEQKHFPSLDEKKSENLIDQSDIMTQPNILLLNKLSYKKESYDSECDITTSICTQVNTSLKKEPIMPLVVKKEINFEEEQRSFTAEETQINFNIKDRNKMNINKRASKIINSEKISIEGDETQPNIFLHSFFSKSGTEKDKNLRDASFKSSDSIDSDDTDIEEDRNIHKSKDIINTATSEGQSNKSQSVCIPPVQNETLKTKNCHEFDENSSESDSVLASVLDADMLEQEVLADIPQYFTKGKKNEICEKELIVNQEEELRDKDLKKNDEIIMGDMDICSTVGNGTYSSVCTSSRKVENSSKVVIHLQSSSKQTTLVPMCVNKTKLNETEPLNHSIMFNEPCGSSTPFRKEERTTKNENYVNNIEIMVATTPPRDIFEEVNSPDLPCTDELVEVACKTPDRQCKTKVSKSNKKKEDLPLALKRSPRVKKLSRKVVEALELKETHLNDLVTNDKKKTEEPIFVKEHEEKKKHVKRKLVERQQISTEADSDKSPNVSSDELLKHNNCVKSVSVSLTEVKTVKDKEKKTEEHDVEGQTSAKRAKNMDVKENNFDGLKAGQSGLYQKRLFDKRQNKHVGKLELSGVEKDLELIRKGMIDDADSKSNEIPSRSNGAKMKRNAEKRGKKSADGPVNDVAVKNISKNISQNISDLKGNNSNSNQSPEEKNIIVNRKVRKVVNEVSSSQMLFKSNSSLSANTRKSSRRKKDISDPISKEKEIGKIKSLNSDDSFEKRILNQFIECVKENNEESPHRNTTGISSKEKEVNYIEKNDSSQVMTTSEPRKEKESKESDLEKTEVRKARGRPQKKKGNVNLNIRNEITECESKIFNETECSTNQRSKIKTRGRFINELVEQELHDKKPNSNDNLKKKSKAIDEPLGNGKYRNTTRLRNKPARFRETDNGSDSSCSGSDKGPSPNKRRKTSKDSSCVDAVNPANNNGNKTKTNKKISATFSKTNKQTNSRTAKVHSELFKTPVVESQSRSKTEVNQNTRSRSRSEYSQSSLKSNNSSTNSSNTKKYSEIFKTPDLEIRSKSKTDVKEKSRSRSRSDSSRSSLKSDTSSIQSPRRQGAKGKRVLFTSGLINPTWESQVKKLGGKVVDCPVECSLLVADKVRRTVKFLCVLGQGKPIVSPDWLIQSWRCTNFTDPFDQLLVDKEAEDKFRFSLSQTLHAAKNQPLLGGYHIHATPSVKPPPEDIKSITECCGGVYMEKVPSKWPEKSIIISHVDDKTLWKKFKENGRSPPIVAAEMLLIGVLQHKLEFKPHIIS